MESRKISITTHGSSTSEPGAAAEDSAEFRVVDKRPFVGMDSEALVDGPVEVKPRYPTYVEELMAKVADTERRFAERVKQVDQESARSKARLEADYERKRCACPPGYSSAFSRCARQPRACGGGGGGRGK